MSEILNANPTIRNASDLPSRRRQASPHLSSKTSLGLFSSTVPASAYAPDPFTPSSSSESDNSDDDDTVEPIDVQEIYGKSPLLLQFEWSLPVTSDVDLASFDRIQFTGESAGVLFSSRTVQTTTMNDLLPNDRSSTIPATHEQLLARAFDYPAVPTGSVPMGGWAHSGPCMSIVQIHDLDFSPLLCKHPSNSNEQSNLGLVEIS